MDQNQYNGLSGTHSLMMGGKTPNNCYCDKKVLHVSLKFSLHGHQQTTVFKALLSLHRTQDSERLLIQLPHAVSLILCQTRLGWR